MDPRIFLQAGAAWYFDTVVITILTALIFITIVLAFLYMTFTKQEEAETS